MDGYRVFRGIPYAASTAGEGRFALPQPRKPWAPNVFDATSFGVACPQPETRWYFPPLQSEDCLTLNVWTPYSRFNWHKDRVYPVMVWIHGGFYEQGASSDPLFDGSTIASTTETVLVTINYRLGALGYLMVNETLGNFGFYDQRAALLWVQENIAAFGGDPSKVTLFGESAGGCSVSAHLVSPGSHGLFHAAIIQSDPMELSLKNDGLARKELMLFAGFLGCPLANLECMRNKTVSEVLDAQNRTSNMLYPVMFPLDFFFPWTPTVGLNDGDIPFRPLEAVRKGSFNRVPLMVGTVQREGLLFVYGGLPPMDKKAYFAFLAIVFGRTAPAVLDQYPPFATPGVNDTRAELSLLANDYVFACPTRSLAAMAAEQGVPVYQYQFTHVSSWPYWAESNSYCDDYACHSEELPYLFNPPAPYAQFDKDESGLSQNMIRMWTNFAATHDPNGPLKVEPQWPQYDNSTRLTMVLDAASRVEANLLKAQCDFWDQYGYRYGN